MRRPVDDARQKVLIIDDLPTNIQVLSEILENEYEIFFATSGKEGLEIAQAEHPDLVLLDIMMPEMDGFEVCRRLKEDPATQSIPVIFVTAMRSAEDEAKGLELGAIDYITKPVTPIIVKMRVRNHMELKRHRDILADLSLMDGLTGISNRRRFDEALAKEWRRVARSRSPLSIIMIDIDFFKNFNDHYGHGAGDDCLKKVARALTGAPKRPGDLVARYGGEEFVALLPETSLSAATAIAERMRQAILDLNISHAYSDAGDRVSISLGVASSTPGPDDEAERLVQAADKHLYLAKQTGRNRVMAALGGCDCEHKAAPEASPS